MEIKLYSPVSNSVVSGYRGLTESTLADQYVRFSRGHNFSFTNGKFHCTNLVQNSKPIIKTISDICIIYHFKSKIQLTNF